MGVVGYVSAMFACSPSTIMDMAHRWDGARHHRIVPGATGRCQVPRDGATGQPIWVSGPPFCGPGPWVRNSTKHQHVDSFRQNFDMHVHNVEMSKTHFLAKLFQAEEGSGPRTGSKDQIY